MPVKLILEGNRPHMMTLYKDTLHITLSYDHLFYTYASSEL